MKKELIIIILMASVVFANFGQTAGPLDFGTLEINESKTLSYSLINTGNESINFQVTTTEDISAEPMSGEIRAFGTVLINVTANTLKEGNYSGIIKAKAIQNATGSVTILVEMAKNYVFEVAEKEKEDTEFKVEVNQEEEYFTYALIVSFIFLLLIFILLIITRNKAKKKIRKKKR